MAGELDAASSYDYLVAFEAVVHDAADADELVLDLSAVTYFDSSALHTTMLCAKIADSRHLDWWILVSDEVRAASSSSSVSGRMSPPRGIRGW